MLHSFSWQGSCQHLTIPLGRYIKIDKIKIAFYLKQVLLIASVRWAIYPLKSKVAGINAHLQCGPFLRGRTTDFWFSKSLCFMFISTFEQTDKKRALVHTTNSNHVNEPIASQFIKVYA